MILTQYEVTTPLGTLARHHDYVWCVTKALETLEAFPDAVVTIAGGPRYRPEGEPLCRI